MKTHKGHEVAVVEGDAGAISARGTTITTLATQMTTAAQTLQDIKSGKLVGEGYAMDKIKDVIGDVHGDLDEAGRRYKPAGSTLTTYAGVLATVQAQMKTIVSDCENSEKALATARTDADQANHALALHETAVADHPPTPDQEASSKKTGENLSGAASSAQSTLATAGREHDGNLHRFDTAYDTWHEAYENAVNGLSDANKIGEDSTWENIAGVLAVISEWVSWIGLAIAVLGLIIGGPFFAIAALVVGVIALALTVALMFDGRKDGWDLAWAVVGILPIGKLGKVFGAGKGNMLSKFGSEFVGQFRNPVQQMRGLKSFADAGIEYGSRGFKEYYAGVRGLRRLGVNPITGFVDGVTERMLFGPGRSFSVAFHESVSSGSTFFQNVLTESLPKGFQGIADAPSFSTFEAMWNTYKWTDRGVSVGVDGKPSGALSPVGFVRGLF
ncbi:hypothetical protein [Microbacterium azadirachtae]|uniref:Uncharacterized protein n=1 Tax=Microbacterium azadirachtae TaxID=582680 RepID=A0A1I6JJ05_9MICO|nr:hypothetical protein [Microbacterium azadirachtae]SFR79006.1 hypothetical protein SAMN04488591_3612 [Microbacterium azadirachtae]